jgi:hypothetical protein
MNFESRSRRGAEAITDIASRHGLEPSETAKPKCLKSIIGVVSRFEGCAVRGVESMHRLLDG